MVLQDSIRARILWSLLLVGVVAMFMIVMGIRINSFPVMVILYLLPALVIVLHAVWTLGIVRGITLLGLAALAGWYFEMIGLQQGTFFGGDYVYGLNMLKFYSVPVAVIIYWAVFVYIGYSISTSFLYWIGRDKPRHSRDSLWIVLGLIILDGITVVALDLFMDPIMTKQGAWTWIQGGPYFGVPLGNFVGWFTITVLVTGVFRLWEYFFPVSSLRLHKSVFLIPLVSYLAGAVVFFIAAWVIRMGNFIWLGGWLMMAVIAVNLTLYLRSGLGADNGGV